MISPKQTTKLALNVAIISIVGTIPMILLRPEWGILTWWPVIGLGVSILLLIVAYLRGAYLTAKRRAAMVDMLNDCYSGVTKEEEA